MPNIGAVLIALAASNTAQVKVNWLIGSSRVSLVWLVLAAALLGWALGLIASARVRWRTSAPRPRAPNVKPSDDTLKAPHARSWGTNDGSGRRRRGARASMKFLVFEDNGGADHWALAAASGERLVASTSYASSMEAKQAALTR